MHKKEKKTTSFCYWCDRDGWWLCKDLACSKEKKNPGNIATSYGAVINVKINI